MILKEVESRLRQFIEPYSEQTLEATKSIKKLVLEGTTLDLELSLGYPCRGAEVELKQAIESLLAPILPGIQCRLSLSSQIEARIGKPGMKGLPNIKNIIVVASGKGGVGKSTIAVNTALTLAQDGATVGLLDADIYGPSQPAMLGALTEKPIIKEKIFEPIIRYGLQTMSIGYLIDQEVPMVWRGPMLGKAIEQMLFDTAWKDLDYLIVDLPPGTGDVQLTLCQKMPITAAIIVTTPQDLALHDVRRACAMFLKLNVPLLGVIENMSGFHCRHCGQADSIFGEGGGALLAKEYNLTNLGSIPLNRAIREMTDQGSPSVVSEPKSDYAIAFSKAARKAAAKLTTFVKDYSAKFPKIVVK